jgi:acyl carrier protein
MKTIEKLNGIISRVLEIDESKLSDTMDINNVPFWDSINQMALIVAIEEDFEIELSFDEISEMNSVKKIHEIIAAKISD